MNKNTLFITIGSIIAVFGFIVLSYALTNKPTQKSDYSEINKIKADDHIKWSPEKKHVLVEYSDFQCPACKQYHDFITSQIESSKSADFDISQKLTFVYRHFPLYQIHDKALDAAYAAEAAGKQGKFFEMSDLLFKEQATWSKAGNSAEYFVKKAQELQLNIEQFKKDRDSKEVKAKVDEDRISGEKVNIKGTPTFFLDGGSLENVRSFDEFKSLLKQIAK